MKAVLTNNLILKLCALSLGYGIWFITSQTRIALFSLVVPLCLDNKPDDWDISGPTHIKISLKAPRTDLALIDTSNLGVHIDCSKLHRGNNSITVHEENLYIPGSVHLIDYNPAPLTLVVSTKDVL
jgi:hypothetical protein